MSGNIVYKYNFVVIVTFDSVSIVIDFKVKLNSGFPMNFLWVRSNPVN